MEVKQQFTVAAGVEQVWAVLTDIPAVARCIPGVEEFTPVAAGTYAGRIRLKVGPLSANFKGRITVTATDAATRQAAFVAEAADSAISSTVKMRQAFQLSPAAGGGTAVTLVADVDVRGRLAQVGWGLIRPKVNSTMQQFAANFQALCAGLAAGEGTAAAANGEE